MDIPGRLVNISRTLARRSGWSRLLQKFGPQNEPFNLPGAAFDLGWVVRQSDALDHGAALKSCSGALDLQVFRQGDGITVCKPCTIAVFYDDFFGHDDPTELEDLFGVFYMAGMQRATHSNG